ncbi:MAG: hypothetical protein AAF098_14625 [Pseudomonadota bacterium]
MSAVYGYESDYTLSTRDNLDSSIVATVASGQVQAQAYRQTRFDYEAVDSE